MRKSKPKGELATMLHALERDADYYLFKLGRATFNKKLSNGTRVKVSITNMPVGEKPTAKDLPAVHETTCDECEAPAQTRYYEGKRVVLTACGKHANAFERQAKNQVDRIREDRTDSAPSTGKATP